MKAVDFYKKFNEIVSGHKNVNDTKEKLTKLIESIKGTDLEGKVNIDLSVADELEKQRVINAQQTANIDSLEEAYDESYEESYEESYDEDDE